MTVAAKTPALRLKGFKGEWEEKRLGDVAIRFDYGLNAAAKPYDGKNKYIRITDIDNESHRYCAEGAVSPDCELDSANDCIVNNGDILFARTGASVGKTYLFQEDDGLLYFAGFLIRAHICDDADPAFVFYSTFTDHYRQFVELTSQRSGQPGINAEEYRSFSFLAPSQPEQQKIGAFLSGLDALIAEREKSLGKLEALKKAMLIKMFPQDGAKVPEVRFKGFEGAWERKKLGEVADLYQPQTISGSEFTVSGYPVYGATGQIGWYSQFNHTEPQITIACRGTCGRVNRTPPKCWITGNAMVVAIKRGVKVVPDFLFETLSITDFSPCIFGSSQPQITREPLSNMMISLAPTVSEQGKIGEFFRFLNATISGRRKEAEKLKQLKKGLLERMFA